MTLDVQISDHGSIVVLNPLTDVAIDWFDEYLPEDAQQWRGGTVIEPRYVQDILDGMMNDGLIVG